MTGLSHDTVSDCQRTAPHQVEDNPTIAAPNLTISSPAFKLKPSLRPSIDQKSPPERTEVVMSSLHAQLLLSARFVVFSSTLFKIIHHRYNAIRKHKLLNFFYIPIDIQFVRFSVYATIGSGNVGIYEKPLSLPSNNKINNSNHHYQSTPWTHYLPSPTARSCIPMLHLESQTLHSFASQTLPSPSAEETQYQHACARTVG